MLRGRGRPWRGRGRGFVRGNATSRYVIRHERQLMHGMPMRGMPSDPPKIEIAPWFGITVMFHTTLNSASPDTITVNDVLDYLRIQLGFPATVPNTVWRIRFQKIRVWADASNTGSGQTPLGLLLEPWSLIGEGPQQKVQDWSGEVSYAKCGWVYPKPQSLVVFTADAVGDLNNVARVSVSRGTSIPVIYYIDVLWSTQTTIINMLEPDLERLVLKDN